ncbi:PepSY-like domain-containing protein [Pontibacter litorisediminis]|uniref:PepSY-like domain-containing protein n=1 Tax=Pontibacter litorisediminis TaxID=1846260 RepID=UPI0023ECF428|nr:PepSY-like domain-containing protein [Pontibacter litorisediminis]
MKSTVIALLFLSGSLFACDKNSDDVKPGDVPAAVKETFGSTFADAQHVEWEKKGEDYEADFDVATVEHDALFSASGNLLKHKYDLPEAELPEAVKASINQNYAGFRVDDADVLVQEGNTLYQVELEQGNQEQKLVFAADGQEQTGIPYWD